MSYCSRLVGEPTGFPSSNQVSYLTTNLQSMDTKTGMLRQHFLHRSILPPAISSSGSLGGSGQVASVPILTFRTEDGHGGTDGQSLPAQPAITVNLNPPAQFILTMADTVPTLYNLAVQAYQSNDLVNAEHLAQQFWQQCPQNTDVLLLLFSINFKWGHLDKCIRFCKLAGELNPNLPEVYCNVGNVYKVCGELELAVANYKEAVRRKPNYLDALINLASTLAETGHRAEAISHYLTALHINPELYGVRNDLGGILVAEGNLDQAVDCYMKCLQSKPEFAPAWNNLGAVYQRRGDLWLAIHHFERAVQLDKNFVGARINLGHAFKQAKVLDRAGVAYQSALELDPNNAFATACLGTVFQEQGKVDMAVEKYELALTLKKDLADVYANLADCFKSKGQVRKAEEYYLKALISNSKNTSALNNLALLKYDQQLTDEAIHYLKEAVKVNPNFVLGHWNLGNVLKQCGRPAEALLSYNQVLKVQPLQIPVPFGSDNVSADTMASAIWCLQLTGDWCGEMDAARKQILVQLVEWQCKSNEMMTLEPLHSLMYPVLTAEHRKAIAAKKAAELVEKNAKELGRLPYQHPYPPATEMPRKYSTKIGYISSEFGNFSIGHLMQFLVQYHRKGVVEVFCYALNSDDGSSFRSTIAKSAHNFVDLSSFTCAGLAAHRIFLDKIQVLVNLDGYRAGNLTAMRILAFKPAPVQVSWTLGYPGTTGANFVDYLLSDQVAAPLDMENNFTEKLAHVKSICFVGCHWLLFPSSDVALPRESGTLRKLLGLPDEEEKAVIYCNFDNWYKLEPDGFATWIKILKQVPRSILWLQRRKGYTQEAEQFILKRAAELGLAKGQIRFCNEVTSKPDQLKLYQFAHVYLDTPQYNGFDNVLDAIWTGVPVVSMACGKTLAGRVSASQLACLGIKETLADSKEAYENVAVKLGMDQNYRNELSVRILDARKKCGLFDVKRYAQELEGVYYRMWKQYKNNRTPKHLLYTHVLKVN